MDISYEDVATLVEDRETKVALLGLFQSDYTRKEYRAKLKELCGGSMGLFHKYHDKTDWSLGVFKGE